MQRHLLGICSCRETHFILEPLVTLHAIAIHISIICTCVYLLDHTILSQVIISSVFLQLLPLLLVVGPALPIVWELLMDLFHLDWRTKYYCVIQLCVCVSDRSYRRWLNSATVLSDHENHHHHHGIIRRSFPRGSFRWRKKRIIV